MEKIKILAIVGPTATGKSELAVKLAQKINGEIISADSMQIYKQLNIATAKFQKDEQNGVKHHLLSCVDVNQPFSVVDYVQKAKSALKEIINKNKNPILVGGTGLYVDSLLNETKFSETKHDETIVKELQDELNKFGPTHLFNQLKKIDFEYAKKIHPNNHRRVMRALQIFRSTKMTVTSLENLTKSAPTSFNVLKIGLNYDNRQNLYDKINDRVEYMMKQGLLKEAEFIFNYCKNSNSTALQAIGYKEFKPYFDGLETLNDAVSKLKQNTRKLAKRQITWFKRDESIKWFYVDKTDENTMLKETLFLVKQFFSIN